MQNQKSLIIMIGNGWLKKKKKKKGDSTAEIIKKTWSSILFRYFLDYFGGKMRASKTRKKLV